MYLCITVAVENQDEKPLVYRGNKKCREKYLMEKKDRIEKRKEINKTNKSAGKLVSSMNTGRFVSKNQ